MSVLNSFSPGSYSCYATSSFFFLSLLDTVAGSDNLATSYNFILQGECSRVNPSSVGLSILLATDFYLHVVYFCWSFGHGPLAEPN
ncbi:hypothetical protein K439DRAFT_1640182 [Ramaria rubella]|nr:hypothetical protein K439DRAFT_1640182 [Ramaria rubella]